MASNREPGTYRSGCRMITKMRRSGSTMRWGGSDRPLREAQNELPCPSHSRHGRYKLRLVVRYCAG